MLLPIGDAASIALFAVLGQLRHETGLTAEVLLRTAVPLLLGWFGAALVLETYRRPDLWRLALTWLLGVTLGVAIRAFLLERSFPVVFWLVALGVTGALLALWRAAVALTRR